MKRPLPLWLAAVLPATIAAHALGYAVTGQSMADGRHLWLVPALESSLAALLLLATALAGGALVRAGVFARPSVDAAPFGLWWRLAIAQTALFVAIERAEGTPVGWMGCAIQIAVALGAALLLSAFARALAGCVRSGDLAARFLTRVAAPPLYLRRPLSPAAALAAVAGSRRFQRPPPLH
jgi:hypothetical protein